MDSTISVDREKKVLTASAERIAKQLDRDDIDFWQTGRFAFSDGLWWIILFGQEHPLFFSAAHRMFGRHCENENENETEYRRLFRQFALSVIFRFAGDCVEGRTCLAEAANSIVGLVGEDSSDWDHDTRSPAFLFVSSILALARLEGSLLTDVPHIAGAEVHGKYQAMARLFVQILATGESTWCERLRAEIHSTFRPEKYRAGLFYGRVPISEVFAMLMVGYLGDVKRTAGYFFDPPLRELTGSERTGSRV